MKKKITYERVKEKGNICNKAIPNKIQNSPFLVSPFLTLSGASLLGPAKRATLTDVTAVQVVTMANLLALDISS